MEDLRPLYQSIEDTKKAISEGNRELAERLGWEMCNQFEVSCHVDEATYTPEMCRLQLDCLATILEIHIMREDPIDISYRYGQFLQKYRMDMDHFPGWTDEDKRPAVEIAMRMTRKVEQFYTEKTRVTHQPKAQQPGEIKCLLCKKNPADKPGSHMVPHLLIARTFSYDGSKDREKVVVDVTNLSEGYKEKYFGHHYEYEEMDGVELVSAMIVDGMIKVNMSFDSSVTIYLDNEDEDGVTVSFPTEATFELQDNGGKWEINESSVKTKFDTSGFY